MATNFGTKTGPEDDCKKKDSLTYNKSTEEQDHDTRRRLSLCQIAKERKERERKNKKKRKKTGVTLLSFDFQRDEKNQSVLDNFIRFLLYSCV